VQPLKLFAEFCAEVALLEIPPRSSFNCEERLSYSSHIQRREGNR
jgi:hypothetical protein